MGLCLRELRPRGGRLRFCLPNARQRLRSAGRTALGLLLVAGGLAANRAVGLPLALVLYATACVFVLRGLLEIWSRRDIVVDLDEQILWIIRRKFMSWHAETTNLREFSAVLLNLWHADGANVSLYHPKGGNVDFGTTTSSSDADSLARRLSARLGLPLRRPEDD